MVEDWLMVAARREGVGLYLRDPGETRTPEEEESLNSGSHQSSVPPVHG